MAFRVETSAEAELDAISILEWLLAQHAGDTGLRWFMAMDDAIASLADFPERCTLAPKTTRFPFEVRQLLYGKGLTYTPFCSLSAETLSMCFTFVTAGAGTFASHISQHGHEIWFPSLHFSANPKSRSAALCLIMERTP
jgi:plasmid stabilization system protein ParE